MADVEVTIPEPPTVNLNVDGDTVEVEVVTSTPILVEMPNGGASALDDLTDVTVTSPSNGQALTYNGSEWVNSTPSATDDTKVAKAGDTMTGDLLIDEGSGTSAKATYRSFELFSSAGVWGIDIDADGSIGLFKTSLSGYIFYTKKVGDNFNRWTNTVRGSMSWGDGTNGQDTTLYRDSAAVLRTDGELRAATIDGGTP